MYSSVDDLCGSCGLEYKPIPAMLSRRLSEGARFAVRSLLSLATSMKLMLLCFHPRHGELNSGMGES